MRRAGPADDCTPPPPGARRTDGCARAPHGCSR
jgi:hypothetical protein